MNTQRKDWLDGLRALAMLLVMLGHAAHKVGPLYAFTSPVKIPLFFAISGYLFHADGYSGFGNFLRAKAKRLMIPWLCLGLLSGLANAAGQALLLNAPPGNLLLSLVKGVADGSMMWFVPCLMWVEILLYWIHRIAGNRLWAHLSLTALCFAASLPTVLQSRALPWHPDTALMMVFFAQLGYGLRRLGTRAERAHPALIAALSAAYPALCIQQIPLHAYAMNPNTNYWPCLPLNLLTCAVGVTSLFLLFARMPIPRAVRCMGRNTLVWYAFHQLFQMGLTFGLRLLPVALPDPERSLLTALPVVLGACLCCAAVSMFINRFCPAIAGSRPTRKER